MKLVKYFEKEIRKEEIKKSIDKKREGEEKGIESEGRDI